MTSPQQQLDQLINDLQNGEPKAPQTTEEKLTAELIELVQSFDLTPDFDTSLTKQFTIPPPTHRPIHIHGLRWIATFVIGLVGLMVLFATVPALRVLAEDIIAEIFPRKNDTLWVIAKEDDTLMFDGDDIIGFTTFDELQANVEFDIQLPDFPDTDYEFSHASLTVPRNTVQLNFTQLSGSEGNINLSIKQQPLADVANGTFHLRTEQDTISPEAETMPIEVQRYHAELVKGAWVTSPQRKDTVYYRWSNHFPMYRLRWKDDLYLYEIKLLTTEDETAIDQITTIAESMMD